MVGRLARVKRVRDSMRGTETSQQNDLILSNICDVFDGLLRSGPTDVFDAFSIDPSESC